MALTLHAHWDKDRLYLWGERPMRASDAGPPVGAVDLRAAVGELSADSLLASVAVETQANLWLPCDERGPVFCASSAGQENGGVATLFVGELRPVTLAALAFSAAQAIDLLTSLPEELPGVCGDSIRYWAALSRFLIDLMARRQFVPHLDETAGGFVARWRPVVQDRDEIDWLERCAAAMPYSCRAMVEDATDGAPDPGRLVESYLAATADALVRRCVADDPFFRLPAERQADRSAPPETRPPETRWLAALLGEDPRVAGGEADNLHLSQLVQGWVGQLEPSVAAAAMRLVFRLEEPEEPDVPDIAPPAVAPIETALAGGTNGDGQADDGAGAGADDWANDGAQDGAPDRAADGAADGAGAGVENSPAISPAWRLHLLLESETDDGEIVDAADLWGDGGDAALLGRSAKNRQARLVAELTRAAQMFPLLNTLLQQSAPSALDLQVADAYAFIRQWTPVLRDQGFGVALPTWADRSESELGLRLNVRPLDDSATPWPDFDGQTSGGQPGGGSQPMELPSGHFGLDALLQFDWQIAVGTLRLSSGEFQALAARNEPLVKLRGQWVQIDLDAVRTASEFLEKQKSQSLTLAEALRTAYGGNRAETGLPVLGLGGTSWIEQLLEQSPGAKIEAYPQPPDFNGTMRPYQLRGLHWMAFLDRLGIGACLADDMGLGKTIQLIALLLLERQGGPSSNSLAPVPGGEVKGEGDAPSQSESPLIPTLSPQSTGEKGSDSAPFASGLREKPSIRRVGPTLLFAPTSVVGNWVREIQRFAKSLKVLIHHGPERLSEEAFAQAAGEVDVVITSYALAHRDREDLRRVAWHRIALDEAQKIKNPSAASTIAIRALTAGRRLALTGTPIENHLSELWSIMEVLNPGLLGPASDFRERFAVPIEKLGDKERSAQLRQMIRPFILRRLKTDPDIAGDLPEKMESKVFCNLTTEQAAQYERLVGQSLNQIDAATGIRRRGLILSILTRLKQICDHPSLVLKDDGPVDGRSGKCERLMEMLEEVLEEGDAALIFTQFREMGHLIERLVTERLHAKVQFLHGGTPAKERDAMIERFQDPANGIRIFILSLRAGGLGLNLTAANHVFHFDRWWNPAVESQATDRAHRVGQTRKVQVHKFVCIGTMEERIDRLLSEKLALADKIIGSGDEWLTSMSTEQLRDYLALSQEAVGDF